jgi:SAM-dependent methyltransferase
LSLELTTDLAMLERLIEPAGKDVLDVGCGAGALVRALAAGGARPIGLEISDAQLARARAADDSSGTRYLVGLAQALPLADASVDAIVFMRSLHHVPIPHMAAALNEAARVLRPGGLLYAAEPLPHGDYYELVRMVEDEQEVRAAAQRALEHAAACGLHHSRTVEYDVRVCLAGLPALRERFVSVDPSRARAFDANAPAIAEAFTRFGQPGPQPGERCFIQPMRATLLSA